MDEHYPQQSPPRISYRQHEISIPLYLILTLVTCGIFNLYWNYRQMEACNEMVGRQEFDFLIWFLLCLVTCGIWHIIYQYKMGSVIVEIQRRMGRPVYDNLPLVSVLVTVFGLSIVADCIHQMELNKLAV
jgi:hypothetical protein